MKTTDEQLAMVESLLMNEAFLWFMDEAVKQPEALERERALDVARGTPEGRETAAQRHDALRNVSVWADEKRKTLRRIKQKA